MDRQESGFSREELLRVRMFRGVEPERIEPLLDTCRIFELPAEQVVIELGDENRYLYLVLSGHLRVHLKSLSDPPVARLEPGEGFGELSMIDRRPASAFVITDEPTRLLGIDEDLMWTLVEHSHAVATNMLVALSQRLRYGNEVIYQNMELLREYRLQALVDPLTALFNRRWLEQMLPRQMERCRQDGIALSALMVDVDHFKQFNDDYGHSAGDKVLSRVARTLLDRVRPGDLVSRYGGEEMFVLLPNTTAEAARIVAERLREAVAATTVGMAEGQPARSITVSLGLAEMGEQDTPAALITAADQALYRAKQQGRNRVAS